MEQFMDSLSADVLRMILSICCTFQPFVSYSTFYLSMQSFSLLTHVCKVWKDIGRQCIESYVQYTLQNIYYSKLPLTHCAVWSTVHRSLDMFVRERLHAHCSHDIASIQSICKSIRPNIHTLPIYKCMVYCHTPETINAWIEVASAYGLTLHTTSNSFLDCDIYVGLYAQLFKKSRLIERVSFLVLHQPELCRGSKLQDRIFCCGVPCLLLTDANAETLWNVTRMFCHSPYCAPAMEAFDKIITKCLPFSQSALDFRNKYLNLMHINP